MALSEYNIKFNNTYILLEVLISKIVSLNEISDIRKIILRYYSNINFLYPVSAFNFYL